MPTQNGPRTRRRPHLGSGTVGAHDKVEHGHNGLQAQCTPPFLHQLRMHFMCLLQALKRTTLNKCVAHTASRCEILGGPDPIIRRLALMRLDYFVLSDVLPPNNVSKKTLVRT